MIAVGKPQVYNEGTGEYEDVLIETDASQVLFKDGKSFQQKLDTGELQGAKGADGRNGLDGNNGKDGSEFVVAASYGTNGYIKYADGTMRQWGETSTLLNAAYSTVYYPQAFTQLFYANACQAHDASTYWVNVYINNPSTTSMKLFTYMPDGGQSANKSMRCTAKWTAFGMWK